MSDETLAIIFVCLCCLLVAVLTFIFKFGLVGGA